MAERRPLAAAVNQFARADPEQVRAFISQESDEKSSSSRREAEETRRVDSEARSSARTRESRALTESGSSRSKRGANRLQPVGLIPVTVRLRPEIAGGLKRASLERQLSGDEIFTQQEIVETVLEPWLASNGYL